MSNQSVFHPASKRSILVLVLLALLLYLVVPHMREFSASWSVLGRVHPTLLALAVAISLVAHVMAGVKYQLLAFRRLPLLQTVLIQLAGLLTNRLLPAGIGGMGINYLYLRKNRHTAAQAGAVIGMNNLIGLLGHMLLVMTIVVLMPNTGLHVPALRVGLSSVALMALIVVSVLLLGLRRRLRAFMSSVFLDFLSYSKRPLIMVGATLCSIFIAASYAGCLLFSGYALGQHIHATEALVVLTLGVAASAVVPTPGGLIGVEAALVAGLTLYHVPSGDALAIALLYRLITYWFALLLGGVALLYVERQKMV